MLRIYFGGLRVPELVALQPNINVKLHIVSASDRREKVFEEIRKPVFSLLEGRPLLEICTFISYESIDELARKEFLEHMSESVLDEYAEAPE